MDELMQALYEYILGHLLEKYYAQTDYAERYKARDEIGRRLWEQLPSDQKACWSSSSEPMTIPRWPNWRPCSWRPSTSASPWPSPTPPRTTAGPLWAASLRGWRSPSADTPSA